MAQDVEKREGKPLVAGVVCEVEAERTVFIWGEGVECFNEMFEAYAVGVAEIERFEVLE